MLLPRMFIRPSELPPTTKIKKTNEIEGIYLIQMGDDGPVKIGISTNIKSRLNELQTGCPKKLKLIKILPFKTYEEEEELQQKFKKYRIRGEWFSKDILKYLIND